MDGGLVGVMDGVFGITKTAINTPIRPKIGRKSGDFERYTPFNTTKIKVLRGNYRRLSC